jgi:Spy/CpxP family protein refolding chaperone
MKLSAITLALCLVQAGAGVAAAQDEQARAHFLHDLGGPFFVSRDKVQEDLLLSNDQKQKLRETMTASVQETMKVHNLKGAEREQAMKSLRQKAHQELEASLKELLSTKQFRRFEQLKIQYETPSILVQPEVVKQLNITDEQRQRIIGAIQEMQKEIEPLLKAAKSGGNPQEILPKVIKLRRDCEGEIVALLTAAQKQQWEEMTGKPLDIW